MVLISLLTLILTIGPLSSKFTSFHLNRVAIIVLLLSGVLAYHSIWLGLLGSGVGIFNGLFQVTSLSSGIDLFIYIVGSLILLMSETGVFKYALQLNKAVQSALADCTLKTPSGGKHPDIRITTDIPQGNLKIIDEYPIIAFFSVLGINCLISSNDIISVFLSLELLSFSLYIYASLYRESKSATSAGLKYFLLGSISSAIILLGGVLIYISNQYFQFSILLISIALLFKVAAYPSIGYCSVVFGIVPTIVILLLFKLIYIYLILVLFVIFYIFYYRIIKMNTIRSTKLLVYISIEFKDYWHEYLKYTIIFILFGQFYFLWAYYNQGASFIAFLITINDKWGKVLVKFASPVIYYVALLFMYLSAFLMATCVIIIFSIYSLLYVWFPSEKTLFDDIQCSFEEIISVLTYFIFEPTVLPTLGAAIAEGIQTSEGSPNTSSSKPLNSPNTADPSIIDNSPKTEPSNTASPNVSPNTDPSNSKLPEAKIIKDLHLPGNIEQAKACLKGLSGIYCFRHVATGKMYIGQAVDLGGRIMEHIRGSSNILLQRAINKYGIDSFEFIVVEFVKDSSLLTTREQVHLDWLFNLSADLRYNILSTAGSSLGYTHTAETKAARSEAQSGVNNSFFGQTHTAEAKAAISAALLGCTNRLGTTQTAESIDQIRLNQPNRIPVFVYDLENKLLGKFLSQYQAAKFLNVPRSTVQNYLASGKVLQGKYILRSSPLS